MTQSEEECNVYCQLFDRIVTKDEDEFLNGYLDEDDDEVCVAMELEPFASLNINGMDGFIVKKLITGKHMTLDFTKLEKFNMRVYLMNVNAYRVGYQKYWIYIGRKLVDERYCPPAIHHLADYMVEHVWKKSYVKRSNPSRTLKRLYHKCNASLIKYLSSYS